MKLQKVKAKKLLVVALKVTEENTKIQNRIRESVSQRYGSGKMSRIRNTVEKADGLPVRGWPLRESAGWRILPDGLHLLQGPAAGPRSLCTTV